MSEHFKRRYGKTKFQADHYHRFLQNQKYNRPTDYIKSALAQWKRHNAGKKLPYMSYKPRFRGLNRQEPLVQPEPQAFVVEPDPQQLVVEAGSQQLIMEPEPLNFGLEPEPEQFSVQPEPQQLSVQPETQLQQLVVVETELLNPKQLKREVSPPPGSPIEQDYFLNPPDLIDISEEYANEINENGNYPNGGSPLLNEAPESSELHNQVQLESPSVTTGFIAEESFPIATLQMQDDRMSVVAEHESTPTVYQPPLLLSAFITQSEAEGRYKELGCAAAQKEINDFAALLTTGWAYKFKRFQEQTQSFTILR